MMNDAEAIRKIVEPVAPVEPNLLCEDLHTVFAQRRADSLVVLSNGIPIGFISYRKVADIFSNQFGYAVYQRLPISELMVPDFLTVDVNDSISEIVESALAREKSSVYEDIVAVQEGKYVGMISIARLLLEQRNRIGILFYPAGMAGHQQFHELPRGLVTFLAFNDDFFDLAIVDVADGAFDQIAVRMDHRGC